jgi:hypothetical protein
MAEPSFASVDDLSSLLSSFDLDALVEDAPKEEFVRRNVRPVYLATMRPKRRKDVDVNDASFGVITADEVLFNDDPSVRFADGETVLAMDEDTGARKRARVLRDLGMGVFEVAFEHNGLKQATYATLMSKAPAQAAPEVEVLDTKVTRVEDERGTTVTTTMTLRNAATRREFEQTTTETRQKPAAHTLDQAAAPIAVVAGHAMDAKSGEEFGRVLDELLYGGCFFFYFLLIDSH